MLSAVSNGIKQEAQAGGREWSVLRYEGAGGPWRLHSASCSSMSGSRLSCPFSPGCKQTTPTSSITATLKAGGRRGSGSVPSYLGSKRSQKPAPHSRGVPLVISSCKWLFQPLVRKVSVPCSSMRWLVRCRHLLR